MNYLLTEAKMVAKFMAQTISAMDSHVVPISTAIVVAVAISFHSL